MFTGIVEEMGTIQKIERGSQSAVLSIRCEKVLEGTQIGDSIAVNGVCLTVTSLRSDGYDADVMAETMNRSSLGLLQPGSRVNLERAGGWTVWRTYCSRTCGRDRNYCQNRKGRNGGVVPN